MDHEHTLSGAAQEWLRRIALNRPLVSVPDRVAAALIEIGFAKQLTDGLLTATIAGKAHLDIRGIPYLAPPKRSSLAGVVTKRHGAATIRKIAREVEGAIASAQRRLTVEKREGI